MFRQEFPEQPLRGLQHHGDRARDRPGAAAQIAAGDQSYRSSPSSFTSRSGSSSSSGWPRPSPRSTTSAPCSASSILLNKEINLLVITALLTLAGYSLTDTVVVFDRIRENLKTQQEGCSPEARERQHQRSAFEHDHHLAHGGARAHPAGDVGRRGAARLLHGAAHGSDRRDLSSIFVASPILVVWQAEVRRQADHEVNETRLRTQIYAGKGG